MFFIHQIGENNNSNRNSFNPLLYRRFRVLRVDEFHGFRYMIICEKHEIVIEISNNEFVIEGD